MQINKSVLDRRMERSGDRTRRAANSGHFNSNFYATASRDAGDRRGSYAGSTRTSPD
ncbi:uncharacterized protein FOMMEDRAFT_157499 [Fomitiporia mediterranea MF3/22]|uniref:uncharacterized protein n=1 Tax=Fomitiporia mediterranea (strain MF3/22) TaxID=694068 RepID=UPI0004408E0C|nr:uncharacterized protein FOMMEDRAFT_157499 [Fomitiporia mediterranea MF3/22]EJD02282.1 hypothetical protein FOMMEDRAFT_157499 [Fomitiporia mediterranea MF3/22]